MGVKVSESEFQQLQGQNFADEDALKSALAGDISDIGRETEESLLGYRVGNLHITPPSLGVLPLLELIESPFLDASPDDVSAGLTELMKTLYVLAKGIEAVAPLLGISRRKQGLQRLEPLIRKNDKAFAIYMEKLDQLNCAWATFEQRAIAFWDEVGPVDIEEVATVVAQIISDAVAGWGAIPSDDNDAEKKT